jgi:hypothetical protein
VDDLAAFAAYARATTPTAKDWAGIKFTDFCAELRVKLEPGQLALCLVAFDGLEPRDLPPELREIGRRIFGPVEVIPPEARGVLVLVAGARGGKSYVVGALRILHLAVTVSLATLAPGESAYGLVISGDPRQRQQCFDYALGAAKSHPGLKAMIVGNAADDDFAGESFTLKRPDGEVTIESIPPKPRGGSGRGRSLVGALLEEAAFFQDEGQKVNDVDVFTAVNPRILPGGQTILSSTPWAELGLLFKEFVANHPDPSCAAPHLTQPGKPHRAIAAHAPTLLLRDIEFTRQIVASETARDPVNAQREYGAQFLPLGSLQFFDPVAIAKSVDHRLVLPAWPTQTEERLVIVGGDLGFVRDAAGAVALERTKAGIRPLEELELKPTNGQRLKPSEVCAAFVELALRHGAEGIVADQHYAESLREALTEAGLVLFEREQDKVTVFDAARIELAEGRLVLPNGPVVEQFREVKKKPLPGGGMAIEQPRKPTGGHGDLASAYVCAIWWLTKQPLPVATVPMHDRRWQEAVREVTPQRGGSVWDNIARRVGRR